MTEAAFRRFSSCRVVRCGHQPVAAAAATMAGLGLSYLHGLGLQLALGSPVSLRNGRATSSCCPTSLPALPAKQGVGGLHGSTLRKLRVLAIHGHAQSASKFKGKIAAVVKHCRLFADFTFINGSYALAPVGDLPASDRGQAYSWVDYPNVRRDEAGNVIEYAGVDASLEQVLQQSEAFDGIMGFSLGAAVLAAVLCHPDHGRVLCKRLEFAAFFSGFVPDDPQLNGWIEGSSPVQALPTFHCFGSADALIKPQRSANLAACFEGAVVHEHPGGHVVPSSARIPFREFLAGLSVTAQDLAK